MEPFVDFGLFEFIAASVMAWIARCVYAKRAFAIWFLIVSVLAPATLVLISHERFARWIAVVCLAISLVNVAALFQLFRRGNLSALLSLPEKDSKEAVGKEC
ncbi:MAG TPA: hypothetical protein VJ810_16040 [Blastocatellia bacterium]|nr:hypothetical protein [Blastocatellia bacterium]